MLCDKLYAHNGGLAAPSWYDVLSWHWLNMWKCPELLQDNLRFSALLHYTSMDAMLAEEQAHFEQL